MNTVIPKGPIRPGIVRMPLSILIMDTKINILSDLSVVASASNKLAPGHQWSISPTVGLAWVMSKENFMKDLSWINFIETRGLRLVSLIPTVFRWMMTVRLLTIGNKHMVGGGFIIHLYTN
mgnify:CR=1 FL=1